MEDTSWRKPVDRIDDLRSEIMFYRLVLCITFLALLFTTAALIVQAVYR
jgi:hypothetical protein